MKHNLMITLILITLFFVTQLFGLATISKNVNITTDETGVVVIEHQDTIVGQPPKTQSGLESIGMITFAVIIGTLLILLFIKLQIRTLFKYWYLLACFTTIAVTIGIYITFFEPTINTVIVLILAGILAWIKVFKQNPFVHNITEIFVYTGIAVLFVSLFEKWLWAAFVLLIIISIYDMFAVWQSKHMISLANYQSENKVFAGLAIPYSLPKKPQKAVPMTEGKIRTAILGGGDIAFPLLFSGSVMFYLITKVGIPKVQALAYTSIISVTATLALLALLMYGKKDRFYPAMPFLSLGCFIGYGIIWILV